MAKVHIELLGKDFSLDRDIIETESNLIPRAGEIIDAGAYGEKAKRRVTFLHSTERYL
jgi:hypothetical protein